MYSFHLQAIPKRANRGHSTALMSASAPVIETQRRIDNPTIHLASFPSLLFLTRAQKLSLI